MTGLALRLFIAITPGYAWDIRGWSLLAKRGAEAGVEHVYDPGLHNPSLGVYPPLYQEALTSVGLIYEGFISPDFEIGTPALGYLLKLFPILGECLLGLVIYLGLSDLVGKQKALWSTAFFIFNPAILYTTAYWGMFGDSWYTLFVVMALLALKRDNPFFAAAAITAGVLFKPQTVAFVPLVMWWSVHPLGWKRIVKVTLGAGLVAVIVGQPFIEAETIPHMVAALRETVGLFPLLSANAHNIWYLGSMGQASVSDAVPLFGPFTARSLGLFAFGGASLYALSRPKEEILGTAAYLGFSFFMLSTEMHENYLYPTVVLLMVVCSCSRLLGILALTITATSLANMALHDVVLDPGKLFSIRTLTGLRLLNSIVNVFAFLAWGYFILRNRHFARYDNPEKLIVAA